ncbi:MAG: hypothetical protein EXQ57_03145 [Bryobacterales bacterium]|nr:hypothetical protein [Bryobacterales bacterium]
MFCGISRLVRWRSRLGLAGGCFRRGRAFGAANGEAVDELLLQLFVRCAGFPERLHEVAGRNEAFVLRHGEQGGEGVSHLAVWVTFGEIAKDLGSDGAAAIVFVSGGVDERIPDVISHRAM